MRFCFTRLLVAVLCVAPLCASASLAQSGSSNLEARRESLKKLIAEEWEFEMRESPLEATDFGDDRYNDRIDDMSIAAVLRQDNFYRQYLARLETIDTAGFPEQEQLNKTLLARKLLQTIADDQLKTYEMPLDQFNGIHLALAQFPAVTPTDSVKAFEDYLSRLHQVPRAIDEIIASARQGQKDKLMPPKFVLEEVARQCDGVASAAGESSAFALPLKKFPAAISPADRQRLHDAILAAIDTEDRPAFAKLAKFVREDYEPFGRTEPGIWSLPDGDARYRAAVREMTTTEMTPEQIYELGLAEVKSTEAQMTVIAKQQGYPDWKSYAAAIMANPKLRATSRDEILETYRRYVAQMRPKLPQLFDLQPKAPVEIVPVEPFREKEAAAAFYFEGTPDGSRPGKVYVNTGDFGDRELPEIEATAYHEGIPGHHMQLSIQQELPALPPFRQHAAYTAYIEGWGLYAERLGKEVGFYQDPNDDFERLASDLFRSARLVEDTGVHYKRWSRDQMVQFFKENSLETGDDLQAEVDRYISYPGQALSYKIGLLKILELRKRAEDQLGGKFDIRAFHDEILDGGALPLDVLDARTNAWIESVKSGKAATGQ